MALSVKIHVNAAILLPVIFFTFPRAWNEEEERKLNPSLSVYCKQLKIALLSSIND
jgi:hypothetical protein